MGGAGSGSRLGRRFGRKLEEKRGLQSGLRAARRWVLHLLGCRGAEHELPLRLQSRGLELRRGLERIDAVQQRELRSIGASVTTQKEG